jgi:hypothetical protein
MRKPYQEVPALGRPCTDDEPDFGTGMGSAVGW